MSVFVPGQNFEFCNLIFFQVDSRFTEIFEGQIFGLFEEKISPSTCDKTVTEELDVKIKVHHS